MEVSSWDGTLSSRDFQVAAPALAENWKQYNPVLPPWTWVPCLKKPSRLSQEQGYLSLEKICLVGSNKEHEEEAVDEEELEPVDDATLMDNLWDGKRLKKTYLYAHRRCFWNRNGHS